MTSYLHLMKFKKKSRTLSFMCVSNFFHSILEKKTMSFEFVCEIISGYFFLQWSSEVREHCPKQPIILVGCKTDLRTDAATVAELAKRRTTPIMYDQVCKLLISTRTRFQKQLQLFILDINSWFLQKDVFKIIIQEIIFFTNFEVPE